jgi:hypothetical protein
VIPNFPFIAGGYLDPTIPNGSNAPADAVAGCTAKHNGVGAWQIILPNPLLAKHYVMGAWGLNGALGFFQSFDGDSLNKFIAIKLADGTTVVDLDCTFMIWEIPLNNTRAPGIAETFIKL